MSIKNLSLLRSLIERQDYAGLHSAYLEVIEEELNRTLNVRVVCNNLDTRTHFSNELLGELEKFHSAILAEAFISHTVRLKEAAAKGVSIFDLEPQSKAARQFLALPSPPGKGAKTRPVRRLARQMPDRSTL